MEESQNDFHKVNWKYKDVKKFFFDNNVVIQW